MIILARPGASKAGRGDGNAFYQIVSQVLVLFKGDSAARDIYHTQHLLKNLVLGVILSTVSRNKTAWLTLIYICCA